MDQLTDYSDSRNKGLCINCGSGLRPEESNRDHVPTRGLLNAPLKGDKRQCKGYCT